MPDITSAHAASFCNMYNSSVFMFCRQVVPDGEIDDDGTIVFGLTAASEDDVKALLHLRVLRGVTQVARHRNLGKGNSWWPATY